MTDKHPTDSYTKLKALQASANFKLGLRDN